MTPFALVKNHVLLKQACMLDEADAFSKQRLTKDLIEAIVALIPSDWLKDEPLFENKEAQRSAYATFLLTRMQHSDIFIKEAQDAREKLI